MQIPHPEERVRGNSDIVRGKSSCPVALADSETGLEY